MHLQKCKNTMKKNNTLMVLEFKLKKNPSRKVKEFH
jgi:hypothetical protein